MKQPPPPSFTYRLMESELAVAGQERNIELMVDSEGGMSTQCVDAMIGVIKGGILR